MFTFTESFYAEVPTAHPTESTEAALKPTDSEKRPPNTQMEAGKPPETKTL